MNELVALRVEIEIADRELSNHKLTEVTARAFISRMGTQSPPFKLSALMIVISRTPRKGLEMQNAGIRDNS